MPDEPSPPAAPEPSPEEWLNLSQAARRLGWPREKLRSLARRGRLQARRMNTGELLVRLTPELLAQGQPMGRPMGQPAVEGEAGPWGEHAQARLPAVEAALADAEAQVGQLRVELAEARAQAKAAQAVAAAEIGAKNELILELKALLAEARRPPWWRRWGRN